MEVLLVFFIVLVIIFIVIRAFWLWYWKINETVSLLTSRSPVGIRGHHTAAPDVYEPVPTRSNT